MRLKPRKFNKQTGVFYRINSFISAQSLRVLDDSGKQIGILSRDEALKKARDGGVDLVEIAPTANPPVAKIIDFKKFKYIESKKKQQEKRKQKKIETKEIRLSPFIGQHDFDFRAQQAREFLEQGNPVKITILFHGRLITRKDFGFEVMKRFFDAIAPIKIIREPKFEGKILVAQVIGEKKQKEDV